MENDPKDRRENPLGIRPEQIWNVQGMIQQAVMLLLMIITYSTVYFLTRGSPGKFPGLETWLSALHGLFRGSRFIPGIFGGAVTGLLLAAGLFMLDAAVGWIGRRDLRAWVHRSDFMLPRTREQRKWAWIIAVTGSVVEEILFRGYIFLAILHMWDSWLWPALILSAVFGFLHAGVQGFWSTLWIFMISMLLCYFVTAGKSMYFLVAVHMTVNVTNLFLLPALARKIPPAEDR
jgi:membrane protease YdiL (CAAX protease family)